MSEPASSRSNSGVGNLRGRVFQLSTFLSGRKGSTFEASILHSPALVPVNEARLKDLNDWSKLRDVSTEIGLSIQTLLENGLTSGQFVEARNASEDRCHIARVVALGFHSTDGNVDFPRKDVAYVAPLLVQALRLNCHLKAFLPPRQREGPVDWITINPVRRLERQAAKTSNRQGDTLADAIPVAKKVVFQKIGEPQCCVLNASPVAGTTLQQRSREASEKALRTYFKHSQRCLSAGDVFGLWVEKCSRPNSPWDMFRSNNQQESLGPVTWQSYRVIKVDPPFETSVSINPSTTMVSLKGGSTWGSCPMGLRGYASAARNQLTYDASTIEDIRGHPPTIPLSKQSLETLGETMQAAESDTAKMEGVGVLLPLWRELAELMCPLLHTLASDMEFRVSILLTGPAGCGKKTALEGACRALGLKLITVNCMDLKGSTDRATSSKLNALFEHSLGFSPCALLLKNVDKFCVSNEPSSTAVLATLFNVTKRGCAKGEKRENGVIEKRLAVVVGTSVGKDLQPSLRRCFTHEIAVDPPDANQRDLLLRNFLGLQAGTCDGVISEAVKQTAGVFPRDLRALAADARATAMSKSIAPLQKNSSPTDQPCTSAVPPNFSKSHPIEGRNSEATASGVAGVGSRVVTLEDLGEALDRVKKRTALEIGAPKVPNVRWDDVGGLEDVKKVILETVELPMKHRQLFGSGVKRRSGVLLYGPPGVGKTLIAKAIATECSINFMSVKGPELLNMYIGESERHVREVFERARRAKPCVVFFDELDALAPARGVAGDSAGVMDRVVSQLLAEIDGIQGSNTDVFIFGATNRPDLVDPALIRPGRLDALVYVGLPAGAPSRVKILKALTRKFHLADEVDLESIAEKCSERFTGADLYALCADAWMVAMRGIIDSVGGDEQRLGALQDDPSFKVVLSQDNFMKALGKLKPSLSEEQAQHYLQTRAQYETS